MKRLAALLLLLAAPAGAAVYEIGPGKTYTTIGAAPWSSLQPGDNVKIYYATYHEKLEITVRGTEADPIVIEGIADGGGNLPIIDGTNATEGPNFACYRSWPYGPSLGLVYFGVKSDYGSNPVLPGWIVLKNLRIQGAVSGATWTDKDSVPHTLGARGAAGIYIQTAEHLTLEGLEVTDNGNGIFGNSNFGNSPPTLTRSLTVRKCKVWGNGTVGGYLDHNAYIEADGVTYEYNWFGAPRAGAEGNNVKDRSNGFVFRYNWVTNGAHLLDLVECQEGCGYILNETTYRESWVYGNVFWNVQTDPGGGRAGAARLFHYGAEYNNPRNGTLFFYNNTVVNEWDSTGTGALYRGAYFQFYNNSSTAEIHNNVFFARPYPGGVQTVTNWYWKDDSVISISSYGNMTFGNNLVSTVAGVYYTTPTGGTVTGTSNNVAPTGNDPGFVDVDAQDFHLAAGSEAIDTGSALPAVVASGNALGQDFTPAYEYVATADSTTRTQVGSTMDMGAFEDDGVLPPTITTTLLPDGVRDAVYTTTCLALTGGTAPYTWAVSAGSICAGLSLAADTGCISGTPSAATTCSFTARVTDNGANQDTQALSITITEPPPAMTVTPQVGSDSVAVTFGIEGLAYNQSCYATLLTSAGVPLSQSTVSTGLARRVATFTGLNPGGDYKVEATCGAYYGSPVSFTTKAASGTGATHTYKAKVPAYAKTAAIAAHGNTNLLGLVVCYDSDCSSAYECKKLGECPGDVCSTSHSLPTGVHYVWHRWSWLPLYDIGVPALKCGEDATYATSASRKGFVAIP